MNMAIVPIKRDGKVIHWATLPARITRQEAQDLARMFPGAYVESVRMSCGLEYLSGAWKRLDKVVWHPSDMPWARRPLL